MEPQDNKQLALRKAITAHEQAEAALADLMTGEADSPYGEMLQAITRNLGVLRAQSETTQPADKV
jgi:hypothetical protein